MNLLLDSDIILDIALIRKEFYADSNLVFSISREVNISAFLSWHSVASINYFVAKEYGKAHAFTFVSEIIPKNFKLCTVTNDDFLDSFKYNSGDFEDAMQITSAVACRADFIITRDKVGFRKSPIKTLAPKQFLKMV